MEEASRIMDSIASRFFSLSLLLFPLASQATTFGPISVNGQVSYAQYVLRGRIESDAWVMEDRQYRRPQTHWKLKITEQLKGNPLGSEITLREKGGELNGYGYHVAGAASFRRGEDVIVNVQDTDEPDVKQLVGLSSGKYTVETEKGKTVVKNGLGFVIRDAKGEPLSPTSFTGLVKRIVAGSPTEADKNIFVNQGTHHDHDPALESRLREAEALRAQIPGAATAGADSTPAKPPTSFEEAPRFAEESEGSSVGWWLFFAACFGGALLLLFRRK